MVRASVTPAARSHAGLRVLVVSSPFIGSPSFLEYARCQAEQGQLLLRSLGFPYYQDPTHAQRSHKHGPQPGCCCRLQVNRHVPAEYQVPGRLPGGRPGKSIALLPERCLPQHIANLPAALVRDKVALPQPFIKRLEPGQLEPAPLGLGDRIRPAVGTEKRAAFEKPAPRQQYRYRVQFRTISAAGAPNPQAGSGWLTTSATPPCPSTRTRRVLGKTALRRSAACSRPRTPAAVPAGVARGLPRWSEHEENADKPEASAPAVPLGSSQDERQHGQAAIQRTAWRPAQAVRPHERGTQGVPATVRLTAGRVREGTGDVECVPR